MMEGQRRVRSRVGSVDYRQHPLGKVFAWNGHAWQQSALAGSSVTWSNQDAWYGMCETTDDEIHRGPPWRSGGPFTNIKLSTGYSTTEPAQGFGNHGADFSATDYFTQWGGYYPYMYQGGFVPLWPSDSSLPVPYRTFWNYPEMMKLVNNSLIPSLSSWGPTAWALTAPKIEMAQGYVALAEGRDVPHMLKRTAKEMHLAWDAILASGGSAITSSAYREARRMKLWKQAPKEASNTFLNQVFGWSPFIKDMRSFYNAYQNTASYMARMAHGNNKWKTYRRTLQDIHSSTKIASGTNWVLFPGSQPIQSQMTTGPSTWEIWDERSTLITSAGQFKWYKPEFEMDPLTGQFSKNSAFDNVGRQLTMYGIRVSPSNVWRATPWSWLIDWGFNVGRSLDRMQEQLLDGVVSKYLYLMHHDIRRLELRVRVPFKAGDVNLTFHRLIDVKQRKEAGSPYGFDLSWETFSPMRLAILAALGITRSTPR